jgi:hypothetical protein
LLHKDRDDDPFTIRDYICLQVATHNATLRTFLRFTKNGHIRCRSPRPDARPVLKTQNGVGAGAKPPGALGAFGCFWVR